MILPLFTFRCGLVVGVLDSLILYYLSTPSSGIPFFSRLHALHRRRGKIFMVWGSLWVAFGPIEIIVCDRWVRAQVTGLALASKIDDGLQFNIVLIVFITLFLLAPHSWILILLTTTCTLSHILYRSPAPSLDLSISMRNAEFEFQPHFSEHWRKVIILIIVISVFVSWKVTRLYIPRGRAGPLLYPTLNNRSYTQGQ